MKEFYQIWNRVFGKTYDAVNTNECPEKFDGTVVNSEKNEKTHKFYDSSDEHIRSYKKKSPRKSALTYVFFGFGTIFTGLFILLVDPYRMLFNWKLTFGDGGEIYELWHKPPVQLFLKVYLWNITNKEEYMSGKDTKLKFQEVGPYVYRELMTHENVTFNNNGTLTANPSHPLVWVPELSEGRKEDDLLILPNIALLSIADVVARQNSFLSRVGLNLIIRQTKTEPLVQMTAKEFMFGYKSTLMTLGNKFMGKWIYFDKLGLIDRMYEFSGDYETVYTGTKHGLKNVGLIEKYNGDTKIPQWDSPCGDITGSSDGTKFLGNYQDNDTMIFFRKSMCRAKKMVKVNETVMEGFQAYVYHFADDVDDNGRIHEKNRCFCKEDDIEKCLPVGLLDVRECYYGFPIALSYPHFLDGDQSLFNKVESGIKPDPEKHKTYFVIERESGLPINLAVRYQINMALGNLRNIANSEKFSNMVLPLLWTEIGMYGLPSSLALRFKLYLNILPVGQTCLMYVLLISGPLLLAYSIYRFIVTRRQKQSQKSVWLEDDFVMNIDRKLSSYIPSRKNSLAVNAKELEIFVDQFCTSYDPRINMEEA